MQDAHVLIYLFTYLLVYVLHQVFSINTNIGTFVRILRIFICDFGLINIWSKLTAN